MTPTATQPCPHCGAPNAVGSTFCAACGKALPTGYPTGPRVLGKDDMASTAAGQKLQGDELLKLSKKASGALLAVAIIATFWAGVVYFIVQSAPGGNPKVAMAATAIQGGVAVVFWCLWFWARVQPLPAAIVGIILYGTLLLINVVLNAQRMSENQRGSGFGGCGIGLIDIVIIAVLFQAIQNGTKYRKLQRQQSGMM